jgi:putative spermidine/putrescine transport system ATP-binding protein
MSKGHIEQDGSPREIYNRPASRFVASFIGEMNFLDDGDGRQTAVRPEYVSVRLGSDGELTGVVRTIMMLGHYTEMTLDTRKGLVKAYISADEAQQFTKGDAVSLEFHTSYAYQAEPPQ